MSYYYNPKPHRECYEGETFGHWTVLDESCRVPFSTKYNTGSKTYWKCRCSCGKEKFVRLDDLKAGNSKSCGCQKMILQAKTIAKKHSN
ncbi:MAG: hypothetical protein ACOC5T_07675 [Elusimicrobiota bacterium]